MDVSSAIRSAYLDTNVFVEAAFERRMHAAAARVVSFATTRRIWAIGSAILVQEIRRVCRRRSSEIPLRLYAAAVSDFATAGKQAKHLGRVYADELRIKPGDALHLALAVGARADVLISWNREDLVRSATVSGMHRINQAMGLQTPSIMTPAEFVAAAEDQGRRGRLSLR